MTAKLFISLVTIIFISCSGKSIVNTSKVESKKGVDQRSHNTLETDERRENMLKGLEYSFEKSNYCALVKQTKLTTIEINDDAKKVSIQADVFEVFTGSSGQIIFYDMTTEKDEETILNSDTIVVCLCKINDRFLWTGLGSTFTAEDSVVLTARALAEKYKSTDQNGCVE